MRRSPVWVCARDAGLTKRGKGLARPPFSRPQGRGLPWSSLAYPPMGASPKPNRVTDRPQRNGRDFGIAVFQGKGGGQMELDFGFEFTHSPGDFQDTVL